MGLNNLECQSIVVLHFLFHKFFHYLVLRFESRLVSRITLFDLPLDIKLKFRCAAQDKSIFVTKIHMN